LTFPEFKCPLSLSFGSTKVTGRFRRIFCNAGPKISTGGVRIVIVAWKFADDRKRKDSAAF